MGEFEFHAIGRGSQVLLAVCLLAAGCTATPYVRETRNTPTGIENDQAIGLLLTRYAREHGAESEPRDTLVDRAGFERAIDECLRREMAAERGSLRLVAAQEVRERAFPGGQAGRIGLSGEALLARLGESPRAASLRYVIALEGKESSSGPEVVADGQGGAGFIAVRWQYRVSVKGTVLDLHRRHVSGSVSASARGARGAGIGILLIPFPIFVSNMPEVAELCRALGGALARFIAP